MKLVSKTFAGILLAALSFCAFAQTAPVTASTPPVKLADDTDDKKATAFDVADANVEALCARLKAAGTPASQNAALRELGKFRTHCLGNGNGGTAAGSKPAGGNTTGNADAFKALAEQLAAAKRALQASAAEAASCPTGSWHIFQAPTGAFTRFCKGQKDEVYLPPTPAVVQQVAPVADPAIVHNAGAARVVTGATPAGGASPVGFQAYCEAKFNNGIVREYVTAVDATDQSIRRACDTWAKSQATARGVNRDVAGQANGGSAIFVKP